MQRAKHARGLRFLPKTVLITTVGLIGAAIAYQASAQVNVYTAPVGFITQTANASGLTFWGLGMTQLPTQVGLVGSIASNQMIDTSGSWSNDQFDALNGSGNSACEIEFLQPTGSPTNWAFSGLIDEVTASVAPNIIYTSDPNDASLIAAGYRYQIRPSWTLNALFGSTDSGGLFGASTAGAADNVQVWNPNTQGFITYFYKTNTSGGGVGWRASNALSANAGTNILYLDGGLVINRKIATSTNVLLVGAVKDADPTVAAVGQTIVPVVQSGLTFAGYVYASSLTLGQSGLYTTNPATGLFGASTAGAADNVQIWNPVTQGFITYFFKTNTNGGGVGWRASNALSTDASTNVIPLGSVLVINRKQASPFNWFAPQPY